MKILHINRNYVDTPLHQLLVEQLEKNGYKNHVFVPRLYNEQAKVIPNGYVSVSECFSDWHKFFYYYKQKRILKAAEQVLDSNGYDLIHAYTLFTDGNCARNLSKKYNIPYVVAVRNTDVNDFFRLMPHLRRQGIRILLDAKAIFFLSESYRQQVFDKYIPAKYKAGLYKKTHVIPNGIDNFWFENKPKIKEKPDKKELNLIYAGRIDKNKNIPTTQRAVKILREKGYNAHLTVVGRIGDKREYKRILKDHNTTYIAPVSKEQLIEYYRDAHVFVMPSFTESFGLVYVEAMSQGLPVIYSKGQGFDGQFGEGVVGYSVLQKSPNCICDVIEKILEHYDDISKNAPHNALRFNWCEIAEKYGLLYQTILDK